MRDSATPWRVACTKLLCPWDFPGKNTGVGCYFLLQVIFLIQGSNPGLPHCRQTLPSELPGKSGNGWRNVVKIEFFLLCSKVTASFSIQNRKLVKMYFFVVQSLSHVQLFATSWTVAHQASPSFTISWSLLKLISIELMMSSNYLIICHPLLLLPSIFPSIRVFSNESTLHSK